MSPVQFAVIGLDAGDEGAAQRRLDARSAHLALSAEMVARGEQVYGAALLDEQGRMIGSAMLAQFADRTGLDGWLVTEPYITGEVWRSVEVIDCAVRDLPLPALRRPADVPRFLVVGRDHPGAETAAHRRVVTPAHAAFLAESHARGEVLFAADLLGDDGAVAGTLMVLDGDSRDDIERRLSVEPLADGVWAEVRVWPCRLGPAFAALHPAPGSTTG